ncbi:hypothetical protein IWQ47_004799 [Aquimarina sp. EL_43]|uniref:hypothetical protein n=1 Tax=Aquimarina TaxID=290174 RepID=UPI00047262E0|nr:MULTISPECIES: hypothetical protein [Aquimarina]MBG6133389.1 hypothetical protein [Aquimarina sp. EL_35]MBG6153547.1 hypothetical protein [Aquimarina sp. EL_32]MBG6171703.1 hypothetical protein [Aquimarina sp. EL_43]
MKNMLKTACLLLLFSAYNCVPAKGVNSESAATSKNDIQISTSKEMIEKGFSKGTIVSSKSEGCPYILNVEEYKDNLDPINLEEFFKTKVPQYVWVKFGSLRMASRCTDARPVSITEIKMRKE